MVNHLRLCSFVFVLSLTVKFTDSLRKFSTTGNCCSVEVVGGKRIRKRSTPSSVIFDEGINGMKWNKKNITYRISEYSDQLSRIYVDTEIAKAFRLWSDHADLEFIKINNHDDAVDIDIRFCQGDHNDSTPFRAFDIAHAFAPEEELGGDIHFNENFTHWHDGTTFLHAATHEIGHALGLNHIPLKFAVMSPYQGHAGFPVHLALEDIKNIQALYGKKPSLRLSGPIIRPTPKVQEESTTFKTTTPAPSLPPEIHIFKEDFNKPTKSIPSTEKPSGNHPGLDKSTQMPITTTTTTPLPTNFPTEAPTSGTPMVSLYDEHLRQALEDVEGSGENEISDTENDDKGNLYAESMAPAPEDDLAIVTTESDIVLEETNDNGGSGNYNYEYDWKNGISGVHKRPLLITTSFCMCLVHILL